jgi:hypothetical protein
MRQRITESEKRILIEAARIKSRVNEMAAGQGIHALSISDLRKQARELGIDPAPFGRNKRELLKALKVRGEEPAQQAVDAAAICRAVNRFADRIYVELYDRCEFYPEGRSFFAGYKAENLEKYPNEWDTETEYREAQKVSGWATSFENFLKGEFGDIFSRISFSRGDKNFIDINIRLR